MTNLSGKVRGYYVPKPVLGTVDIEMSSLWFLPSKQLIPAGGGFFPSYKIGGDSTGLNG